MSEVGKNPNDSLPDGKPLDPDEIVSEDDAGSAAIEKELAIETADQKASEFEGLDNDLVNVGKFNNEPAEEDGLDPVDEDEEQPGLS